MPPPRCRRPPRYANPASPRTRKLLGQTGALRRPSGRLDRGAAPSRAAVDPGLRLGLFQRLSDHVGYDAGHVPQKTPEELAERREKKLAALKREHYSLCSKRPIFLS